MAEFPASWNLETRKRSDGRLDVIGHDDLGRDYKVRTCESSAVTEADVHAISECDREKYSNREEGARSYVKSLIDAGRKIRQAQDDAFQSELEDLAGPAVRAGLERTGATVGSTHAYRRNYDRVFGRHRQRGEE